MPAWLSSLFLNPAYVLPGLGLVAAPILIHLINRLRYKKVKWAAMEFLLKSIQRNRRRLLLEQLLLLLLRVLLIVGLVALIARPVLDPDQLALFQGAKTHHVVVLDDSGSQRDRWGDTTGFAEAKSALKSIVSIGARRPGTQVVSVLLASKPDQPLYVAKPVDDTLVTELEDRLKSLDATWQTVSLVDALAAAKRLLEQTPGGTRLVHLASDFRARECDASGPLLAAIRDLANSKIDVTCLRTVPEEHANVGLESLTGSLEVAAANVPLRLTVKVRNHGSKVEKNIRMTVMVDGAKLPVTVTVDELEAGRDTTREFDVTFATTGPHDVRVLLPPDALDADNLRSLALTIPDNHPVLLIEGDAAAGDAIALQDALAPVPGLTGFAPSVETSEFPRRSPLDRFQSVFLLNVSELPADVVRVLEQYVSAGGGLVWFLGEQSRPAFFNKSLYKPDGTGLFPVELGPVADLPRDETNPAADIEFGPHPIFRIFQGDENPFVDIVNIRRYFKTADKWTPPAGVQVLAKLRNGAPLFLEHRVGKGTVITCLSSCGTAWTNWPQNPSFVPLSLELARHIARPRERLAEQLVGEPLTIALDAAAYSPQLELTRPDGSVEKITATVETTPATGSTTQPAGATNYRAAIRNVEAPGLYGVTLSRLDGSTDVRRYALNAPTAESELKLVPANDLRRLLGNARRIQVRDPGDLDLVFSADSGREIHDLLIVLLAVLLVVEQFLAWKFSHHPGALSNTGAAGVRTVRERGAAA
jgi:hypothetical protein